MGKAARFPGSASLAVLALFELLTRGEVISPRYFPPPSEMFAALADELGTSRVLGGGREHAARAGRSGSAIAALIAIPVGIVVGSSRLLYRSVRAVIEFLRPIPSVALIPLAVLI